MSDGGSVERGGWFVRNKVAHLRVDDGFVAGKARSVCTRRLFKEATIRPAVEGDRRCEICRRVDERFRAASKGER